MRTIVLAGLEQPAKKIDVEVEGQLRTVYKSEPEQVLQVVGAHPPAPVPVNTPFDRPDPVDFVSMARIGCPDPPVWGGGGVIIDNSLQTHSASEPDLAIKVLKIAGSQHYEAVAKSETRRVQLRYTAWHNST